MPPLPVPSAPQKRSSPPAEALTAIAEVLAAREERSPSAETLAACKARRLPFARKAQRLPLARKAQRLPRPIMSRASLPASSMEPMRRGGAAANAEPPGIR